MINLLVISLVTLLFACLEVGITESDSDSIEEGVDQFL